MPPSLHLTNTEPSQIKPRIGGRITKRLDAKKPPSTT